MAKHVKNPASHSEGQRRSSRSMPKTSERKAGPGGDLLTVMSQAFLNATIKKGTGAAIINTCAKALNRGPFALVIPASGWNAHLSFKTAKKLGMPECTNPYAKMPYDDMVSA